MGQFIKGKFDPTPTESQLRRAQQDWEKIAGEPVQVAYIKGSIIGLCSELGALRLEHKYRSGKSGVGTNHAYPVHTLHKIDRKTPCI